jgi:hypothetical protein
MALAHLEALAVVKGPRVKGCIELFDQSAVELSLPGQVSTLKQAGLNRDVTRRLGETLLDGAHAVTDFQTEVPAIAHEALDLGGALRVVIGIDQQQQVNIGAGHQFSPTVSTDCNQTTASWHFAALPQGLEASIGQACQTAKQTAHVGSCPEGFDVN